MATKRTPIKRDLCQRITPAVVAAFQASDAKELRRLLGLKPGRFSMLSGRAFIRQARRKPLAGQRQQRFEQNCNRRTSEPAHEKRKRTRAQSRSIEDR
jgi:hypothetical protein